MSISTLSFNAVTRASILRIQSELRDATKEATTGRLADVGLGLGRLTGNAVTYRAQESAIARTLESNRVVSTRLDLADDTLEALAKSGESFRSQLINGVATASGVSALATVAKANLQQLTGASGLALQSEGQYLFAGTQSDVRPVENGEAAVKADFAAYLSAIGATAANVTPAQLDSYFAGVTLTVAGAPRTFRFETVLNDATFGAGAGRTGDPSVARISTTETVETSVNADEPAFRRMAASFAMVSALGIEGMGDEARRSVVARASTELGAALDAVTGIRADFGVRQNRIAAANTALTQQQDIVKAAYVRLEGVDEAEAATLMTSLQNQLDVSYAVTGRLQSLSILNYL